MRNTILSLFLVACSSAATPTPDAGIDAITVPDTASLADSGTVDTLQPDTTIIDSSPAIDMVAIDTVRALDSEAIDTTLPPDTTPVYTGECSPGWQPVYYIGYQNNVCAPIAGETQAWPPCGRHKFLRFLRDGEVECAKD